METLIKLIGNYQTLAETKSTDYNSLDDANNAIFLHLYEQGYDVEKDEAMVDYMLKATDVEAANYWANVFLPKFLNDTNYLNSIKTF